MKFNSFELEIKNKKFAIKYGLILLGISLLLFLLGIIIKPNIPNSVKGMMVLPFPVFSISAILMAFSYELQIITKLDLCRNFKNGNGIWKIKEKGNVFKWWFYIQSLLGFIGHLLFFGGKVSYVKIGGNDMFTILLFTISPTILFIISSYFARLNRIENKIDLLLSQKEENQND